MTVRGKLGKGAVILSAVAALGLGTASQAGAAEATTYSGHWSVTAVIANYTNTRSYVTNITHKISSCVSVTATAGVGGVWSFELIWYDNGKNKVLWHSGEFEGHGRVCSPVKKPGRHDAVYDRIILQNAGAGLEVQDSGPYSFNTY